MGRRVLLQVLHPTSIRPSLHASLERHASHMMQDIIHACKHSCIFMHHRQCNMRLQPGYDDHACTFACVHGQCHMRDGNCEGPSSVSLAGIYNCASNMPGVS
mmetsp:Transcript_26226/g.77901  ORF Transcript_26226/g.77901 Transcript_26226/m.77901 type:complete len:102 (+) Transcript_26226:275-580(+)